MHALLHTLWLAGIAALTGGVAAVERKGAFQLMLSRPIVLAPVMGLLLGDAQGGLLLGVPLELLFLGGVNLGGNLPDNETLLTAALTAMVIPAGLAAGTGVDGPLAALGLALLFPLALFGRRLERASELRNSQLVEEAMRRVREGDPSATALSLRGLLLPFGATAGICAAAVLIAPLLGWARLQCPAPVVVALGGAWHAVAAVAGACAIRAIRDPRGPLFAGIAVVAMLAFAALTMRSAS
ncbi:MAG TPA: PTS sugar transporter subunit IIC [Myxococcales bacterium]|jgi:mannose/fructose/N-acetylgalactosamine-specific phosphotransferase system component IIC|nr:PTS sugar transporter subunit IIC [Myxococcales bacterium]